MFDFNSILIVEDNRNYAELLLEHLHCHFVNLEHIEICTTLQRATSAFISTTPDMVILDVNLPDGLGYNLIDQFRALEPELPCVMLSASNQSDVIFDSLKLGASGYLLKDDPIDKLMEQLRGILVGRPPMSDAIARKVLNFFSNQNLASKRANLTDREKEVLILLTKGCSRKDIAAMLNLSHHTVADYIKAIYAKLKVNSRAEMTREAINLGLA